MSSRCCGVRAYSLSHYLTQFSSYLLSDSEVVYSQVGPVTVWPTDCESLTVTVTHWFTSKFDTVTH